MCINLADNSMVANGQRGSRMPGLNVLSKFYTLIHYVRDNIECDDWTLTSYFSELTVASATSPCLECFGFNRFMLALC